MKKNISLLIISLLYLIININTIFASDFVSNTNLPIKQQNIYKKQIDIIFNKFEVKLSKIQDEKQVLIIGDLLTRIDRLLQNKNYGDISLFKLDYLGFLFKEALSSSLIHENDIWGKEDNIETHSLIVSNNGWNENTDLKSAPKGTIDITWGIRIYDENYTKSLNIIDVNLILNEIKKNGFETYKMIDNSDMYTFGFEGAGDVNVSLMKSIESNGISNLSKTDLEKILLVLPSQPEKKVYFTRNLKNQKGETIGYGSACSYSQDPGGTISFDSYCIITFDGDFIKEYIYIIPDNFKKEYSIIDNIKSKYSSELDWSKYTNSDFYKETTKFGEKVFNDIYSTNKDFSDYINKLESISIENY